MNVSWAREVTGKQSSGNTGSPQTFDSTSTRNKVWNIIRRSRPLCSRQSFDVCHMRFSPSAAFRQHAVVAAGSWSMPREPSDLTGAKGRGRIPVKAHNYMSGNGRAVLSDIAEIKDVSQPGDLFLIRLEDGQQLYLETVRGKKKSLQYVCQGERFRIEKGDLVSEGFYPNISDPWIKRCPLLVSCLEEIRRMQKSGDVVLPSLLLSEQAQNTQNQVEFVTSLSDFSDKVMCHPSLWCDGSGPNDEPLSHVDQSLLTAGELSALVHGDRGVALLQLSLPLDMGGSRLPLLRPYVFELLKSIEASKDVVLYPSKVPGGGASSLVIAAKRQPFASWGSYLSSFGAQASLVADSEFYKMIIGRIMGYKNENIEHHIISTGGALTPDLLKFVEKELMEISPVRPTLPWKT